MKKLELRILFILLISTTTSAQINDSLKFSFAQYKIRSMVFSEIEISVNPALVKIPSDAKETSFKYSPPNVCGQIVIGALSGVLFSLPFASDFEFQRGNNPPYQTHAWLIYSAYILGTAVGVDWIGSLENESLSFWWVLASSVIGGGLGFASYSIIKDKFYFPILAGPLIGPLIYSLFISD
jgi:hypothetical protein